MIGALKRETFDLEKNKVVAIKAGEQASEDELRNYLDKIIEQFDGLNKIINAGETVLIKPNLVAPSEKATTNLLLIEYIIDVVKKLGARVIVAESAGFEFSTAATFKILGIDDLCKQKEVELINLDDEEYVEVVSNNPLVPKYLLPKCLIKSDKVIDMPRLKGHSITKVTFSIKNLFGLLHRDTRRMIHATDLDAGIRYLRELVKVDFIVVDGLWNLSNAVYGDSEYKGVIVCGTDMLSVDSECCRIFGIDYKTIPHIYYGIEPRYEYVELNEIGLFGSSIRSDSFHNKKQRQYKIMYGLDVVVNKYLKTSLIPYFHYYAGIRPYIDKTKCDNCGKCIEVCPVNAIDSSHIDRNKCMYVRCMRCLDSCPQKAIVTKGFHSKDVKK